MRMGNLFFVRTLGVSMAARQRPRLGVSHVTVVPANLPDDYREESAASDDPDDADEHR